MPAMRPSEVSSTTRRGFARCTVCLRLIRHETAMNTHDIRALFAGLALLKAQQLCFSQIRIWLIQSELHIFRQFPSTAVLSALLASIMSVFRTRAALQLEILALRHQLGVMQRSVKKPKLNWFDRFLWAWLCGAWAEWRSALCIVKPGTVIAWHRKGFRLFWTWKVRRGQRGRPPVSKEVRKLIRKMSRENPYGPKIGKISEFRAYRWRASQVVDQAHADRVDARRIPLNREGHHQHELAPEQAGCRTLIPTGGQVSQRNGQLRGLQVAPRRGRELDHGLRELALRRVSGNMQLESSRGVHHLQRARDWRGAKYVQRARRCCRHLPSGRLQRKIQRDRACHRPGLQCHRAG